MKAIVAAGLVAASTVGVRALDISGAGSTFLFPVFSKWADAYKKESGSGVNYQSIGSGAGIKQVQSKTVTFGASDMPLKVDDYGEIPGLVQLPMVVGGDVPVVNLEGVKSGDLALDGTHSREDLSRRHQVLGRCGDRRVGSFDDFRNGRLWWFIALTVPAPPLS